MHLFTTKYTIQREECNSEGSSGGRDNLQVVSVSLNSPFFKNIVDQTKGILNHK